MGRKLFAIAALVTTAALANVTFADLVTIDVTLDTPGSDTYELTGQSAFLQYRTNGSSSGNQLDTVASPGASIAFTEIFPPPTLSDYLTFAYFGRVNTLDNTSAITDTSFVIALSPSSVVPGLKVEDLFPGYTEAALVSALGTFDSTEFLDLLDTQVPNTPATYGIIAVPAISQVGDTLQLIAFIGGTNGDEGVSIGTIAVTVTPEPASFAILACGSILMLNRRRHARK